MKKINKKILLAILLTTPFILGLKIYTDNKKLKEDVKNLCDSIVIGENVPNLENIDKKYIDKDENFLMYSHFLINGVVSCTIKIEKSKVISKEFKQ